MKRGYYLHLAERGLRMPLGADLVLHEHDDAAWILTDGPALGRVMEEAARRYRTPLAFPLMDLRLEKADLLASLGLPESGADDFRFDTAPDRIDIARARAAFHAPFSERNQARIDAVRYIEEESEFLPVGMAIGPFSLAARLMADPIRTVAAAGAGDGEEPRARMAERCLELAEIAVQRSVAAQMRAGARAMLIAEPDASCMSLPRRPAKCGSDLFERFVMQPNLRLRDCLTSGGADLIFHDCGELTDGMLGEFATRLHPVILSLGSSRTLWEDAALVPKDVVLFGNLPTGRFHSDAAMPEQEVERMTLQLIAKMAGAGHPHIVGSECEIRNVEGSAGTIRRKLDIMMTCGTKKTAASGDACA